MPSLIPLITQSFQQVLTSFLHNWPFLAASIVIAVLLKLYLDPQKVAAFLNRYRHLGVVGATAAAVGTPLCSCGTTAIILGMMASTMPWAPIVAFMAASPLSSPEGLVYSAGLFGWPFAMAYFGASILIGLMGGLAADFMEKRGWLKNQARFASPVGVKEGRGTGFESRTPSQRSNPVPLRTGRMPALRPQPVQIPAAARTSGGLVALQVTSSCCPELPAVAQTTCGCGSQAAVNPIPVLAPDRPGESACGCGVPAARPTVQPIPAACACSGSTPAGAASQTAANAARPRVTLRLFLVEAFSVTKRLLPMFFGFAFIGYLLNGLIPAEWVETIFGSGSIYSIPLAATLGLPLYINSEASLPLVRALIDGGMSQGAAMAFLITGSGTSIGAITGALTIARWRVLALVVATLWVGGLVAGLVYNLMV